MLESSGTLATNTKIQYLPMLLHEEVPCQFDTFCDHVGSTTIAHSSQFILGLGMNLFPINFYPIKRA